MDLFSDLPVWALALLIFGLRLIDVPMGTFRTIAVIRGQVRLAVFLGFFEVLVWVLAISQVVVGLSQRPLLAIFYAGGFAAGNAAGILLERRISGGVFAVRFITSLEGAVLAESLRPHGRVLAMLPGTGQEGPVTLLYATATRGGLNGLLRAARSADPELVYVVDRAQSWSRNLMPTGGATGWRAIAKKK